MFVNAKFCANIFPFFPFDIRAINMPFRSPNGNLGMITLLPPNSPEDSIPIRLYHEYAVARAWTFQERYLSPRILTIQTQFFWTCRETWGCDGGLIQNPKSYEEHLGLSQIQWASTTAHCDIAVMSPIHINYGMMLLNHTPRWS
jgi:hypothetical protein